MKAKMLMLAAALLAFAAVSFGQAGFTAGLSEQDFMLTTTCGGTTPIPAGTLLWVYHDVDGDGADDTDPLGLVCEIPPLCPTGPQGSLNWNNLPMDMDGFFWTDPYLTSAGALPVPNIIYVRVFYPSREAASIVWTSNVVSPPSGFSDNELTTWSCAVLEEPCTPTTNVWLVPTADVGPQETAPENATLCVGSTTHLCVGPVSGDSRVPVISVVPCTADPAGAWELTGWTFMQHEGAWYYCADLTLGAGAAEGCVTVILEEILPVALLNATVTPLDGAVKVTWQTASETNTASFAIDRDGEPLATLEAANNPSGASYEYTDETAENGHTYKYDLYAISLTGSRELLRSFEGVAPSIMHAVITEYALGQNYPNPFNPTTNITFDVVESNPVTLTVYNATGQVVATLLNNSTRASGRHNVSFDATNLTSGLYFYTVKIGNEFTATKKMLLVK